jgi:hypothetical protein
MTPLQELHDAGAGVEQTLGDRRVGIEQPDHVARVAGHDLHR